MIELSVVIPVKDEELILHELVQRLTTSIGNMGLSYELIFVTDINKDRTFEILKEMNQSDAHIKVVKLSTSFGHHVAVTAGLSATRGNTIVIMDGDLQDYPEDIPKLYTKLKEGFDVVYGVKEKKNDSALRNLYSMMFVKMINWLSDYKINFNTSMFRIVSRRTVEELLKFKEREPSLTALISLIGYPVAQVQVTSGVRLAGQTKYSFLRQINFAVSFLLSFSTKPLRIISYVGFTVAGLSFLYLFIVLMQRMFFHIGILGWPTLVSLITFLGGLQLFALGVIGEYIGRIFMETKNRPLYTIEEKVGDLQ